MKTKDEQLQKVDPEDGWEDYELRQKQAKGEARALGVLLTLATGVLLTLAIEVVLVTAVLVVIWLIR